MAVTKILARECCQVLDTKRAYEKMDGIQYYHIVQSFKPGEVTPEMALAKDHKVLSGSPPSGIRMKRASWWMWSCPSPSWTGPT